MNKSVFMPNDKHIQILNEIGRWKIISVNDLFLELEENILYTSFCKILRMLEESDMIKAFWGNGRRKYYSLTSEGGKFSLYSSPYLENESESD